MCLLSCPGVRFNAGTSVTNRVFLEEDLARLAQNKVGLLLSCLCESELKLGVKCYADAYERLGIRWEFVPIPDMTPPTRSTDVDLETVLTAARPLLAGGFPIAIHCMAGLGRTGTVGARFAMSYGLSATDAIEFIRSHHDRAAIETLDQEAYLHSL